MNLSEATLKAIQLRCTKCNKLKPATEFTSYNQAKRINTRYGMSHSCDACIAIRKRKQRDTLKIFEPEYYRESRRAWKLKTLYRMTHDDFEAMLVKQLGRCAICKGTDPGRHKVFCIDHDHVTRIVRGLLCSWCNTGLGKFHEDCVVLANARLYLEHYESRIDGFRFLGKKKTKRLFYKSPTQEYRERTKRSAILKSNHGVSLEWYEAKLLLQGNACGICETETPGRNGLFCIDHCHRTQKNRGLLCSDCNFGIGQFKDNPFFIGMAVTYLNRHSLAC